MVGAGARHSGFQLDVQRPGVVETAIFGLPEDWSQIDILVNNAGLSRGLTKLYEDDPQNWEEMIDTNVKGLLYVTRAVVPGWWSAGAGHVINMGSTAGYITYANGAVYCATKAAEKAISEGLKIDLMGTPVRVTRSIRGWWSRTLAWCDFVGMKNGRRRCFRHYATAAGRHCGDDRLGGEPAGAREHPQYSDDDDRPGEFGAFSPARVVGGRSTCGRSSPTRPASPRYRPVRR